MGRRTLLVTVALAIVSLVAVLVVAPVYAGGPGKWTKLSTTAQKTDAFDEPSAVRTADGKLHVIYRTHPGSTTYNIRWVTLSQAGKVLNSGNVLASNWGSIDTEAALVPDGSGGLRAVWIGGFDTDPSNFYSKGAVYTATSPDGETWTLQHVSMASHTVLNGDSDAGAELDGTPVAAFGLNATTFFHEGTDASAPAATPDGSITQASTIDNEGEALATDTDG